MAQNIVFRDPRVALSQAKYRQDVINAYNRYQEQQLRNNIQINQLELQQKHLPQVFD